MNKEQLYIFLDIDGVICSPSWCGFVYCHEIKPRSMEFDPRCLGVFNHLCRETKAKIIISSVWRSQEKDFKDLQKFFAERGIEAEIVGRTFTHHEYDEGGRGREIQDYLDQNPEVTNYIIIDDESDAGIGHPKERFFYTNGHMGFTVHDYQYILENIGWYDEVREKYHAKRKADKEAKENEKN